MPRSITVTEAAAELGVNTQRVRALIAAGRLKTTKVNERLHLIEPRELDKVRVRPNGRPPEKNKKKKRK